MDKWDGLVAVVTGASSGIGKSVAIKLAEHGMKVAALARREDRLKELEKTFKGKGSIKGYKCDISKATEIEQVFKQVEKDLGRIKVLVNNAGVATSTELTAFEIEKWHFMFDLNVFGMFSCIKHVVNSIKSNNETGLVHIFNINSIAGHNPPPHSPAYVYSATKHCVTLLTRGLIKQIATEKLNIRVTSVSPGVVDTEIFEVSGWGDFNVNQMPHLKPDDIANAITTALSAPNDVIISELTIKPKGEAI